MPREKRARNSTTPTHRGVSPLRGLSPFHKGGLLSRRPRSSSLDSQSSRGSQGSHDSSDSRSESRGSHIILRYDSAQSIVFRDDLRRATKIKEEENEDLSSDSVSVSDNNTDNNSDGDEVAADDDEPYIRRTIRKTLRDSIRDEASGNSNLSDRQSIPFINTQELDDFAKFLVPNVTRHLSHERHLVVQPLEPLPLNARSEFQTLLELGVGVDGQPSDDWTTQERDVFQRFKDQAAVVKTIRFEEWTTFFNRFHTPVTKSTRSNPLHSDIPPHDGYPFNSFVTSTSLLPELAKKMRVYGSTTAYNLGVVFGLPDFSKANAYIDIQTEEEAVTKAETWAWPAGYAAKTEFNIDGRGNLINGRQEALVSLATLRQYNHEYIYSKDHQIGNKLIKGGFTVIPYNEVYVRVGGHSRQGSRDRSLGCGVGLPIALFARTAHMGDLVSLFRTRERLRCALGEAAVKDLPLLLITHEWGVRVFSKQLQSQFWEIAASQLQPFQNPQLEPLTKFLETKQEHLQQKHQELLDLSDDQLSSLSLQLRARIAGGFGATDESFAHILHNAYELDNSQGDSGRLVPGTVNKMMVEALMAAVQSADHFVVRQLLLVYSWVFCNRQTSEASDLQLSFPTGAFFFSDTVPVELVRVDQTNDIARIPPGINTDNLRSATSCHGVLVYLGAAQILQFLQEGTALDRTRECVDAVQEWIRLAEQSVAFRLASWRTQRAAEGDTLAVSENSKMLAFAGKKAITNRRRFAEDLNAAITPHSSSTTHFLSSLSSLLLKFHHPCLRLELLQYILGLDNRYSASKVRHAMELATTCLSLSLSDGSKESTEK